MELSTPTFAMAANVVCATLIVSINKALLAYIPFPTLLACVHAMATWFTLYFVGIERAEVRMTHAVIMAGLSLSGIVLSNINLATNSLAVFQASRILMTPVTCLLERLVLGRRHSLGTYAAIFAVCLGVTLSLPDVENLPNGVQTTGFGIAVALASCIASSAAVIFVAYGQTPGSAGGFGLLRVQQPIMAIFGILMWASGLDAASRSQNISFSLIMVDSRALLLLGLSCAMAAVINISSFLVVGKFSALVYQMLGHLKTLLITAVAILVFHESISLRQAEGLLICAGGLAAFSFFKDGLATSAFVSLYSTRFCLYTVTFVQSVVVVVVFSLTMTVQRPLRGQANKTFPIITRPNGTIFILAAGGYSDTCGGCLVLHRLGHLLNTLYRPHELQCYVTNRQPQGGEPLHLNPNYNLPVLPADNFTAANPNAIWLYPEIVRGNPHQAFRAVRWILYFPEVYGSPVSEYNTSDLIACYGDGVCQEFTSRPFVTVPLVVVDPQLQIFDEVLGATLVDGKRPNRTGTLVFVKKNMFFSKRTGRVTKYLDPPPVIEGAITLSLSQSRALGKKERIEIFSKYEYCYFYDPATFCAVEAAVAGCIPIVVPMDGVDREEWLETMGFSHSIGIAYGASEIDFARRTMKDVRPALERMQKRVDADILRFVAQAVAFFEARDTGKLEIFNVSLIH